MVKDGAFGHKIDYVPIFFGDSKSQRASKLYYWFKSYGNFAEWVYFAYWWSCIGKGMRLQPAQQACFTTHCTGGNCLDSLTTSTLWLPVRAAAEGIHGTPGLFDITLEDRARYAAYYRGQSFFWPKEELIMLFGPFDTIFGVQ